MLAELLMAFHYQDSQQSIQRPLCMTRGANVYEPFRAILLKIMKFVNFLLSIDGDFGLPNGDNGTMVIFIVSDFRSSMKIVSQVRKWPVTGDCFSFVS